MYPSRLILSLLEKDHPEILSGIIEKLKDFKSKEFTPQNVMQAYFDFAKCTNNDITEVDWSKNIELRRDLVAFMMLTFEPERIRGYEEKAKTWGLATEVSSIIKVHRRLISYDMQIVCDYFKIYKDVKNRWLSIFNKNSFE